MASLVRPHQKLLSIAYDVELYSWYVLNSVWVKTNLASLYYCLYRNL